MPPVFFILNSTLSANHVFPLRYYPCFTLEVSTYFSIYPVVHYPRSILELATDSQAFASKQYCGDKKNSDCLHTTHNSLNILIKFVTWIHSRYIGNI